MAEGNESNTSAEGGRIVLFSYDDSVYSKNALQFYCDCLKKKGDIFHTFHVQEIPTPFVEHYGFSYAEDMQAMFDSAKKKAEEVVAKFSRICKEKGLDARESSVVGHPGDQIVETAHSIGASLIIMGTRGQGLIRRTILGSVSDYVVHHTSIPVCVVPYEEKKD